MKRLILIIALLTAGCGSNENCIIEPTLKPEEIRCNDAKVIFEQAHGTPGIFLTFKIEYNGIFYTVLTDGKDCIEAEVMYGNAPCVTLFTNYSTIGG